MRMKSESPENPLSSGIPKCCFCSFLFLRLQIQHSGDFYRTLYSNFRIDLGERGIQRTKNVLDPLVQLIRAFHFLSSLHSSPSFFVPKNLLTFLRSKTVKLILRSLFWQILPTQCVENSNMADLTRMSKFPLILLTDWGGHLLALGLISTLNFFIGSQLGDGFPLICPPL